MSDELKRTVYAIERPANAAERMEGFKVTIVDIRETSGEAAARCRELGPPHGVVRLSVPDRRVRP